MLLTLAPLVFRRESDFWAPGCILIVVRTAPETSETANPVAKGIFDEPSISRQWVARRLQRALTVERWGGPARTGLSRLRGDRGRLLLEHGQAAGKRAQTLESLIREVGAEPYFALGIGAPTTRFAAALLGRTSGYLAHRLATLIAEHTLSEYRGLEAFVQDAPGVPADIFDRVISMRAQSAHELEALAGSLRR